MTSSRLEKTEGIIKALRELDKLRTDFFVEGMEMEHFDEIVDAVRTVDAETVAAIHLLPDGHQREEDGREAAEKWLRAEIPKEEEL